MAGEHSRACFVESFGRAVARRLWGSQPLLKARALIADKLHRFSNAVQPPFDEDPWEHQLRLVRAVSATADGAAALEAARTVLEGLDESTIYLMLMLMARDFAQTSTAAGRRYLNTWSDERQFFLITDRFSDD
ncbi:hypothetical protein [Aeromicrobium sp.]|uniref:hypothetical protein n=1 Tax=Aeromicrobium sp. TaxID=1871063 RepID=UPI0030BBCAA8